MSQKIEELKNQISQGNIEAMVQLGGLYYYGDDGIEPDQSTAVDYYWQAATAGSVRAMVLLGRHYQKLHNYSEAKRWFEEAIRKHDEPQAKLELGIIRFNYGETDAGLNLINEGIAGIEAGNSSVIFDKLIHPHQSLSICLLLLSNVEYRKAGGDKEARKFLDKTMDNLPKLSSAEEAEIRERFGDQIELAKRILY